MIPDSCGSLVLSVPIQREGLGLLMSIIFGTNAVIRCLSLWRRYQSGGSLSLLDLLMILVWLVLPTVYAWPRNIRFYENGVQVPRKIFFPKTRRLKAHFISWNQIQSYHWDGDSLYLVEVQSLDAEGIPVAGEPWAIRPRNRPEVESILARHVAGASAHK